MDLVLPKSFWRKVDINPSGCWLWTGALNSRGYGCFGVNGKSHLAHRLMLTVAKGPIPSGYLCCHHCDVPNCVNPTHLFAGSPSDNVQDMLAKGRNNPVVGVAHKHSRLNPEIVLSIRARHASGESTYKIAKSLGLDEGHVWQVVHRKIWAHVERAA